MIMIHLLKVLHFHILVLDDLCVTSYFKIPKCFSIYTIKIMLIAMMTLVLTIDVFLTTCLFDTHYTPGRGTNSISQMRKLRVREVIYLSQILQNISTW